MSRTLAADIRSLAWAAEQLGIGVSTAYRLAPPAIMAEPDIAISL